MYSFEGWIDIPPLAGHGGNESITKDSYIPLIVFHYMGVDDVLKSGLNLFILL